jgi:two-component system, OmpR family, copper resistance phosphate regulon response regulator CusR
VDAVRAGAPARVLIIEDNPSIATHLAHCLEEQGSSVKIAATAAEGQWLALHQPVDTILLDVMLPDMDGIALCAALRKQGIRTPILMVTALGGANEKIRALDAGADDYLVKPVHMGELSARLRAVQRRGDHNVGAVLRFEDLELNINTREMTRGGQTHQLRPKEAALLEYLLRNPGRVLARAEIGERAWEISFDPESNIIEVYISILRKKMGDPPLIQTISGVGYRLSVPERGRP